MTAKLSSDSVALIFKMYAEGEETRDIAKAVGCARSTVVAYLNAAGIVLGQKGRPKEITEQYIAMVIVMRADGKTWYDIEERIGFHRTSLRQELRRYRQKETSHG